MRRRSIWYWRWDLLLTVLLSAGIAFGAQYLYEQTLDVYKRQVHVPPVRKGARPHFPSHNVGIRYTDLWQKSIILK